MALTFDEVSHTYRHDGQLVPSVTQVLAPLTDLSAVPADILAAASAFGTAVHKACELHDLGTLDPATLDAPLQPYLDAWLAFCRDHDAQWSHIEQRLYHPVLRYAGTADRIGFVDGLRTIVDIKTSAVIYPAVGPQLAAYLSAAEKGHQINALARMSVRLKPDGGYEAKAHTGPADFAVFASLLTLRTWCRQHRITPRFQGETA